MSHFPGRAPPAPPSGFDDSGLDMRAIKQAGGKVLPGEHSQIAKLQKPNRFIPPSASTSKEEVETPLEGRTTRCAGK
jgi:hypothetical protein